MAIMPTKWISSAMSGAPTLTNAAGSLINVLDAALVTGFGSIAVDSLIINGGVATLTKSTGHGFLDWQIIEISGAVPDALNGQWRFTRLSATQGIFSVPGLGNQTATGTITAKTPALGWTKPFVGANQAAYRNDPILGTGAYLWISDPASTTPRARGFTTMSDISTGTDPYPTDALSSGGTYFPKASVVIDTTWHVLGSQFGFYLAEHFSSGQGVVSFFGDILSAYPGDVWRSIISGVQSNLTMGYMGSTAGANDVMWMPRNHLGAPGAVRCAKRGPTAYSGFNGSYQYPSPINGGVIAYSPVLLEQYSGELRGRMPGYVSLLNNCAPSLVSGTILSGVAGFPDPIICLRDSQGGNNTMIGVSMGGWM